MKEFKCGTISIIGKPNTGKSTLFNKLSGANVITQDMLFATLDPTTRRLVIPMHTGSSRELLITDTVGFIRDLPEPLMEAFRATLEETLHADLLLLLVDLSNPDWRIHLDIVNQFKLIMRHKEMAMTIAFCLALLVRFVVEPLPTS